MSLSRPQLTNPSEHFFEWKGQEGALSFYDKEKQERIKVPLPFSFIVLDQLHTVTGYDKMAKSGFWSNEIRNIRTDDLTVRTKSGVKYVGPYKNEQGIAQMPKGANYTKSVYIAHPTKSGEWIMGNIKMAGSALTAWIEFTKNHAPDAGKITMTRGEKQSSPVGDFYPPAFSFGKWTEEEYNTAIELDKQLQVYLNQYLTAPKYDDNAEPISEDAFEDTKATPEQIADFEAKKAKLADKYEDEEIKDLVTTDFDDSEPINLDEIPF